METTQKNSPEEIEAAERMALECPYADKENDYGSSGRSYFETRKESFLAGINYQKERSYTREELKSAVWTGHVLQGLWGQEEFDSWFNENYPETK